MFRRRVGPGDGRAKEARVMNSSTTRRVLAVVSATALACLTLGAAPAAAGVSGTGETEVALFVSNDKYALFTGPPFDQGCANEGFLRVASHVVQAPSGFFTEQARGENPALLYDLEAEGVSDHFQLLDKACSAYEAGEPLPVPIATGTTSDRLRYWGDDDVLQYMDRAIGTLVTPEGRTVKVNGTTRATITFSDEAPPQVSYTALTLKVHPLG
jgi:hypothetical protein